MKRLLRRFVLGGFLALLILGVASPNQAQAQTNAELMVQIQALLVQIQELQSKLIAMQGGAVACAVPQSDLTLGSRGADVTNLQNFLIGKGYGIPAGATGYFGSQTQTALQKFQAANGISPALGYNFGPQTRARIQNMCTVAPVPNPTPEPKPAPQPEPELSLSGEASLERFTVKDGDDTDLEEGDKSAEIMEVSFRVDDGDVKINRIDLGFTPDNANNEKDPWDVFGSVSVWHGSKKVAEVDASREKNWKEDSPANGDYLLRMSGLSYIVREGREVELTVKADVQRSVKGTADGEIWNVFVPNNGIRGLDADNAVVYAGDTADAVTLNIDQGGSSDELIVRRSDADPDSGTLQAKDNARSGYLPVFAFDLDTDDSKNDIDIRRLPVELTVSNDTLNTFMRDIRLIVDGKTYTKESTVDGSTGVVIFEFNRGELSIGAGDRVTAMVEIDFKALSGANEGTTIAGHVDADDIDAEGSDDLNSTQLQGAATGETHVLYTKGSEVVGSGASAVVTTVSGELNDYVTFSISVNVTAFGQDVYIPVGSGGVSYQIQDAVGNPQIASGTAVVSSNAKERGDYFHIPEGSTEKVTLDVTYQPGVANTTARLQLLGINFNGSEATPNQSWSAVPTSLYRTPTRTIVN